MIHIKYHNVIGIQNLNTRYLDTNIENVHVDTMRVPCMHLYSSPTFVIAKIMSLSLKEVISFIKTHWTNTHPRPTRYPPTSSMNIIGQVSPQTLVTRDTCMVCQLSNFIQGLSNGLQHNYIGNLSLQC